MLPWAHGIGLSVRQLRFYGSRPRSILGISAVTVSWSCSPLRKEFRLFRQYSTAGSTPDHQAGINAYVEEDYTEEILQVPGVLAAAPIQFPGLVQRVWLGTSDGQGSGLEAEEKLLRMSSLLEREIEPPSG